MLWLPKGGFYYPSLPSTHTHAHAHTHTHTPPPPCVPIIRSLQYALTFPCLQPLISELKSFIQELKSQLTTLYHQFAPLPAPPEDDEQLREKLNRLYIGASSVTQKSPSSASTGAAVVGDVSSHENSVGLSSATCTCTYQSQT